MGGGVNILPAKLLCFVCSSYFCHCSLRNLADKDAGWISTPTSKENAISLNAGPPLSIMKPSLEVACFQVFCPHSFSNEEHKPNSIVQGVQEAGSKSWSEQDCWTSPREQLVQYLLCWDMHRVISHNATSPHIHVTVSVSSSLHFNSPCC